MALMRLEMKTCTKMRLIALQATILLLLPVAGASFCRTGPPTQHGRPSSALHMPTNGVVDDIQLQRGNHL
jgi:hypothetical protein